MSKSPQRLQKPLADLQRRAREAVAIADDESLPRWQRALNALRSFSGTQLTGLPPGIYRKVEKHLVAVNRVLDQYDLKKGEDYQRMTDDDLQDILDIVKALASSIMPA